MTRQLMDYVAGPDDQSRRDRALGVLAKLTEREREVATAVAQGKSNAEIATDLSMGVSDVGDHADPADRLRAVSVAYLTFAERSPGRYRMMHT